MASTIFNEDYNFIGCNVCHGIINIDIAGPFVGSSFAQENITTATNDTGAMMGNQTNQTGGNQSQGPLEQLGEALGGVFGGGDQTQ